jgi:DNA-binding MarR family transcriptional regulator
VLVTPPRPAAPRFGVAFLLAQLGAHASNQFAQALAESNLTPALAGIMRMLKADPGLNQLQLAERLGAAPSRVVAYLDDLESRGWIVRTRDTTDRRVNVLRLTDAGQDAFTALAVISRNHEKAITESLDEAEHATLHDLLSKLAFAQQLTPGVHPGYRQAPPSDPTQDDARPHP